MNTKLIHQSTITAFACIASVAVFADSLLPATAIPDSCGIQLKTHNFSTQTIDQINETGFKIFRRGFYWNVVEPEKGVYDFSEYDAQMDHAKKLGLTVVGAFFAGNKLYEDDGRGGIQTEAGREGFANFAAALAEHYKDHKVIWEVWNEPNVRTFWRKDGMHNSVEFAQEYTDLVKAVAPAVMAANPDAFVVAGSVSNYWEPSYEWTESCFKNGILETGIKGWSVHPYGVKTPEEFAIGHERTRSLLKQYGKPNMPMLNTERGFAVKKRQEGWSGGNQAKALEYQGWHVPRQFFADQMHDVHTTVWYEWDGDNFGLVEGDGKQRPGFTSFKALIDQLSGYAFDRRLPSESPRDYAIIYKNKAGDQKLIAWTSPPPAESPDRAENHTVTIEASNLGGAKSSLAAVNHLGEKLTVKAEDGSIVLAVYGGPQYITIPKGATLGRCNVLDWPKPEVNTKRPETLAQGGKDLSLFNGNTEWKFKKNTGEGSFTLENDDEGKPIGVLKYDFSASTTNKKPYVLATAETQISEGTSAVSVLTRSNVNQQLTFRLVDSKGQTHQFKKRIAGNGGWEEVSIPLTKRLEHWGGPKDGKVYFPITQIAFSVPQPNKDHQVGKVEFAAVSAVAN